MRTLLLLFAISMVAMQAHAQKLNPEYEGIWEGYDGEWAHVSRELIDLANAIPANKYSWRPAPGVRSVSEVYMHIALTNYFLLGPTGYKVPADIANGTETESTPQSKAEVIGYLKRSLEAVKSAHAQLKPADLPRVVQIEGRTATVDGMYLRIIVHNNEHLGQMIAYARVNGIAPPWSTR